MAYQTPSVRDGSGRGSRATGQGRRGGKFTAGGGTASTAQELLGQFGSSSDGSGSDRDAGMNSDALRSGSDDVSSRGGSSSSDSYRGPFVGHRHGGHGSRSGRHCRFLVFEAHGSILVFVSGRGIILTNSTIINRGFADGP